MNGTSTETSTNSVDETFPQTAQEAASAYESASDEGVGTTVPEGKSPDDIIPDAASRKAAALPDNSDSFVPTETLPATTVPSRPATLPTAAVSRENAPPSAPAPSPPSNTAPQPGALPIPRMNLQNSLRLRMKIWTDPSTLKRYLMPMAFMRDLANGYPITDVMYAYAMSDDSTKIVTLTATEWNALPFFYFQEDGYAPRATARPMDTLP